MRDFAVFPCGLREVMCDKVLVASVELATSASPNEEQESRVVVNLACYRDDRRALVRRPPSPLRLTFLHPNLKKEAASSGHTPPEEAACGIFFNRPII